MRSDLTFQGLAEASGPSSWLNSLGGSTAPTVGDPGLGHPRAGAPWSGEGGIGLNKLAGVGYSHYISFGFILKPKAIILRFFLKHGFILLK